MKREDDAATAELSEEEKKKAKKKPKKAKKVGFAVDDDGNVLEEVQEFATVQEAFSPKDSEVQEAVAAKAADPTAVQGAKFSMEAFMESLASSSPVVVHSPGAPGSSAGAGAGASSSTSEAVAVELKLPTYAHSIEEKDDKEEKPSDRPRRRRGRKRGRD